MRYGITAKLFFALFATCMLVVITMQWGVRVSFEHGFIHYIKRSNTQRISLLGNALAEQYALHGSWEFLHNNQRLVYQLLRSFEQSAEESRDLPPHGWRTQIWVLDNRQRKLVGPPGPPPAEGPRYAIRADDQIVGWLVSTPIERLTRNADITFDTQQRRTSWLIVALAALLAAAVAWFTARGLLAPVKRLIIATHRLAAGDFSARVPESSRDELGRLARDFNLLAMTLEKNQATRRAFMADVSHELRTPLAVLRGELEALQDGVRRAGPESLSSLLGEVALLTKLVADLHQLSLSDSGALSYRKARLDLVPLLERSLEGFADRFQLKNIALSQQLPPSVTVFGDAERLSQLFHNVLENSLRYTDEGGQLRIVGDVDDGRLTLRFFDSAPGVEPHQLPHIFERFYRTEGSRNRASGGSGLGLAICHNIVDAHGGQISAADSPLGGLQITLELPLDPRPVTVYD
ncbi:Signal transduction histidine-protein kinase [Sodalis praecaptivus]|uniref:histidine kinase n=1 Tax=Sodalis praecaptivus TaxID=1239307 RepID=W0HUN9_9GAMM|nr:two-component system sensor histidine kinase BaeS [Sodalis praecaptivus]AHF76252.1 Signal transduction histidine-protein kinase [Sodalis praecaptivus]